MMKRFSTLLTHRDDSSSKSLPDLDNNPTIHSDMPATSIGSPATSLTFWHKWYQASKEVFPIYFAVHLAFLVITCLSFLFTFRDLSPDWSPSYMLWQVWDRWDTGHYMYLATHGYTDPWRTAFFPLFPLLERGLMIFVHSPLIAGLMISNLAGLVMLVVFYQLVQEDFDHERASRAVLYLSVFPTAFFFATAYTESLFLCLALLSFYHMRHGQWWLAGLFGFFASLTRSAGIFLLLPFCYEYLRHHQFQLKNVRLSVVSVVLIPAGVGVFAFYCYILFGDWLAFSHAQAHWGRQLTTPWWAFQNSLIAIKHSPFLSYQRLHNLLDLIPALLILTLIVLSAIGPWRFPRTQWSYCIYAATLYCFVLLVPLNWTTYPLMSFGRFMLEIFPAFIVLATLGKYRVVHLSYLLVSGATLFFLLTQFLLGHFVV